MDIKTSRQGNTWFKELIVDGTRVSWLTVVDYKTRLGGAALKTGGIVGVGTDPAHRHKGYARIVLDDAAELMQQEHFALAMLVGIPGMYHKFGYAQFLCRHKLTIPTKNAEESRVQHRVRDMAKKDAGAVLDIYTRNNESRNCTIVRGKTWDGFHHGTYYNIPVTCKVLCDGNGVAGYAVIDATPNVLNVAEVGCRTPDVFPSLMGMLAAMAVAARLGEINLFIPPDHPLAEYCCNYECDVSTHYYRNETGMIRLVDQDLTLNALLPALGKRLADSRFSGMRTPLEITTDLGSSVLHIAAVRRGGRRPVLSLPQDRLVQLLTGYRSARNLLEEPGVTFTGRDPELLEALFPKGYPYLWHADWF